MAPRRGNHSILCSGLLAAGLILTASAADAQSSSRQAGLRMLSWPGKAEGPRVQPPPAAADIAPAEAEAPAPLQVQPSVLPDYTASARNLPQRLTAANAFGSTPVAAGGQAYASAPVPYSQAAPRTVEAPAAAATPAPRTQPPRTPVAQTPVVQTPVPQTPVRSPRTEAPDWQDDPMAPRADAPVWRTAGADRPSSQAAAQPAPRRDASAGSRDGARYYSVHREAGRDPDPTTLPAPFFLDSAPVDLAEPPPPPTLMRSQGGLAPSVAGDDL